MAFGNGIVEEGTDPGIEEQRSYRGGKAYREGGKGRWRRIVIRILREDGGCVYMTLWGDCCSAILRAGRFVGGEGRVVLIFSRLRYVCGTGPHLVYRVMGGWYILVASSAFDHLISLCVICCRLQE